MSLTGSRPRRRRGANARESECTVARHFQITPEDLINRAHCLHRQGKAAFLRRPLVGLGAIGTLSDASLGPSSIPSLGDGVMLGTAWIDRPVDTQDLHSLLPRPP